MILDSSILVAILGNEPEAATFEEAIAEAPTCKISAASYVEAAIVVDCRHDPVFSRKLDDLLHNAQITIEPLSPYQARLARDAYRDYGKGRHRAGLNFGDCFAYALAKDKREPLLFKGEDFRKTDVEVAEY